MASPCLKSEVKRVTRLRKEISMPCKSLQEPANYDVEKYFQHIITIIPAVVRKVCANLGHYPDQEEIDSFVQQIVYLLWQDDYRVLRNFKHEAAPETWLFTIIRRQILQSIREGKKLESLEAVPPEYFQVEHDQEKKLLLKEREEVLQDAVDTLTSHDQKLFGLLRQELSTEKIADEMGIKRRSASVMKRILIVKLKRIIREKY
jgi:RNA polymerase sigma factor (sigma-70 family)